MLTQKASIKKAFTLTELLVSMAVLGLIATLTLPHMFMSADRAKKRAVFKEAYQALQEAVQLTYLEGGTSYDVIKKLNTSKICDTHSLNQGCTQYTLGDEVDEPGVVLSTGVTIFGLSSGSPTTNGIMIGLEDFPKKEYFYTVSNYGDVPYVTPRIVVRPGELKCGAADEECRAMFKND